MDTYGKYLGANVPGMGGSPPTPMPPVGGGPQTLGVNGPPSGPPPPGMGQDKGFFEDGSPIPAPIMLVVKMLMAQAQGGGQPPMGGPPMGGNPMMGGGGGIR